MRSGCLERPGHYCPPAMLQCLHPWPTAQTWTHLVHQGPHSRIRSVCGWRLPTTMSCDFESPVGAQPPQPGEVRVGTWNMSHWSAAKATLIATMVGAEVVAVQETHLAPLPLEWAHTTTRSLGLHLHHMYLFSLAWNGIIACCMSWNIPRHGYKNTLVCMKELTPQGLRLRTEYAKKCCMLLRKLY